MKDNTQAPKHPSRGRRYSPAEKAQIMEDAKSTSVTQAAEEHRCSKWTIYDWLGQERRKAAREDSPTQPAEEASRETDERHQLILELWRQQPGLGPSQIRNLLKRRGFKASVNTVRQIMEDHGYVQPKTRRKEHTGCYEAVRPLQLYHLDFYHFHVHRQKQCLLLILDDYSRFITGWCLIESERADEVIEAFETAVTRYGKPEAVMSDRGAAFHSWKGLSRFTALLTEYGCDHYIATEPQVNGKVEALNASIQKELIRQVEFADLADAWRQIKSWIQTYNYRRTHHGLGGLLVPADRFHGWEQDTLLKIEQGQGAEIEDLTNPQGRGLELFKIISVAGQPTVYLMGRKLLG